MLYKKFKHEQINNCTLVNGDCLEVMDDMIENGIKVDAVICDPPYQITACKWDKMIPFDDMWERLNKLIKPNSAIVLFGNEPFSSALRMSNIKNYKYDWVWEKAVGSNFAVCKYQPLKEHENIIIFSNNRHNYYPIKEPRKGAGAKRLKNEYKSNGTKTEVTGMTSNRKGKKYDELKNPSSVQYFNNRDKYRGLHPTQKPIALMEYLIKTYTNEGKLILDFTAGSFSTCVAAENTNRRSIGIELEEKYYNIGIERLKCCMKN